MPLQVGDEKEWHSEEQTAEVAISEMGFDWTEETTEAPLTLQALPKDVREISNINSVSVHCF